MTTASIQYSFENLVRAIMNLINYLMDETEETNEIQPPTKIII